MIRTMVYVIACAGGAWLVYLLFGAAIDNRLGVLTSRDIAAVKGATLGDGTVDGAVAARYVVHDWSGRHREEAWRTTVRCEATDREGAKVVLAWEVNRGYSPALQAAAAGVHITALTRGAGQLAPQFLPPGMSAADLPEHPTMTATALFGLVKAPRE